MYRPMLLTLLLFSGLGLVAQPATNEMAVSGVYQGTPLFIQNPYLPLNKEFCIESIYVNNRRLDLNYNKTALVIEFEAVQKFSPVFIKINYREGQCKPVMVNPNAIRYHSLFSFEKVQLSDTALVWSSKGEALDGRYIVEFFNYSYWSPVDTIAAKGQFGVSTYVFYPMFEPGANKFQVRYETPDGKYLYSHEVEQVYYPEDLKFQKRGSVLIFSKACSYEIYDRKNNMVSSGQGKSFDFKGLPKGEYNVICDKKDVYLMRHFE
jgi:hypothetical protein